MTTPPDGRHPLAAKESTARSPQARHPPGGRTSPSVHASDVSKSFDGRPALDQVSFRAWPGEVHAVLGENGAGKTTLMAVISGMYRADQGELIVDGRRTAFRSPRDALRAGIGVVHQEFRLIENLTVGENVVLGTGRRLSRAARAELTALIEGVFELDPDARVHDLDIGHRQQVEILKLLFRRLDILIFDEPTTVLGAPQVTELFGIFSRLARQRKTVIFITHRLREVRQAADRITVLRSGRVMAADRLPAELSDAELTRLMVGTAETGEQQAGRARRGEAAGGASAPVLEITDAWLPSMTGSGLRGATIRLLAGEVLGVAGIRGNGQRELAELAAGLSVPHRGTVRRHGQDVAYIPEDRLGMGLAREMPVAHNLALRCYRDPPIKRRLGISQAHLRGFAAGLIRSYQIPADGRWRVVRLSGGGLQRVVVGRELERRCPVIVAVQPTRGLDVRSAAFVRNELVKAAGGGAGVLLMSEDLDELTAISDRVIVLYAGQVVADLARGRFDRQALGRLMVAGRHEEP